jgi:uncharacterized protein
MSMSTRIARAVLLVPILAALACGGEGPPPTTGTVTTAPLRSSIVGAGYVLSIRLPPGYEAQPDRRYPLVVQLDPTFVGLRQFEITAGLVSARAASGALPEAIVVGVDDEGLNQRLRDYAVPTTPSPAYGGDKADRFYAAMRDEIVPFIEGRYRVDPARRVLIGHSMGATFAWYATFRHAPPAPPLFSGILASDVGIEEALFVYERWHAERSSALPLRLYFARAVYNGVTEALSHQWMAERLDARRYEGLTYRAEVFETDHGGIIQPSFESGLGFILGGAQ